MGKTGNSEDVLFDATLSEIESLSKAQIEEMRELVKDRPSTAQALEELLKVVSLKKLLDAVVNLPFERRSQALDFAVASLQMISDIRTRGGSDAEVEKTVHRIFDDYR